MGVAFDLMQEVLNMSTHTYTQMVTKNIAITDKAYTLLSRHKRPGESFSQVIVEHFQKKKHLSDFAGIWADMPESAWKEFEFHVLEARKGLNASLKKRIERLKI
mgnify:CR=1 FL=1